MIRQITSASRHRSGYMAQHPGRANIPMSSGFDDHGNEGDPLRGTSLRSV